MFLSFKKFVKKMQKKISSQKSPQKKISNKTFCSPNLKKKLVLQKFIKKKVFVYEKLKWFTNTTIALEDTGPLKS